MLGNRLLLNQFAEAVVRRRSNQIAESTRKRFEECDRELLMSLAKWEDQWAAQFPVFAAWLLIKRKGGLAIPNLRDQRSSAEEEARIRLFQLEVVGKDLLLSIETSHFELEQLLKAFTPSMEEAFDDVLASEENLEMLSGSPSSGHLREVSGVNDELFTAARDKFNYLSRKQLPKLMSLVQDAEAIEREVPGEDADRVARLVRNSKRLISTIQTSSLYRNFLMLLSQENLANQKGDGGEFDDWF